MKQRIFLHNMAMLLIVALFVVPIFGAGTQVVCGANSNSGYSFKTLTAPLALGAGAVGAYKLSEQLPTSLWQLPNLSWSSAVPAAAVALSPLWLIPIR